MVKSNTAETSTSSTSTSDFLLSPSFTASIQNATEFLKNLQQEQIDEQLQQINEYQQKNRLKKQDKKNVLLAQLSSKDVKPSSPPGDSKEDLNLQEEEKSDVTRSTRRSTRSNSNSNKIKKSSSKPKNTKSKSSGSIRRKSCNRWTKQENEKLKQAIAKLGEKKWNDIAQFVGTKNSDQCNQHWHRVINPKISKKPWTEDEDDILIDRVFAFGESSWKKVAEGLKGRTDIQCRHRYIMLKKYEKQGKGRPIVRKIKEEEEFMEEMVEVKPEPPLVERRHFSLTSLDLDEEMDMQDSDFPSIHEQEDMVNIGLVSPPNFSHLVITPSSESDSRYGTSLCIPAVDHVLKVSPMHIKSEYPSEWSSLDCYEQVMNPKSVRHTDTYSLPEYGSFQSEYSHSTSEVEKALNAWNDLANVESGCSDTARSTAFESSIDTVMTENPDWMQHTI